MTYFCNNEHIETHIKPCLLGYKLGYKLSLIIAKIWYIILLSKFFLSLTLLPTLRRGRFFIF